MSEYDRLKKQKEEILAKQKSALEADRDLWKSKAERLAEALKAMQMEAKARNCGLRIADEALAAYEKDK